VDVRQSILEEATRLFAHKGFDGTSVQEVAEAVGIRKPSLLYHFTSKDELRQAVLGDVLARWSDVLPKIFLRASKDEQFDALMEAMSSFFVEDPDRARIILREALDRPDELRALLATHVQPWVEVVAGQLDKGKSRGVVRPEVDTQAYALHVVAMVVSSIALLDSVRIVLGGEPDLATSQKRMMNELFRVARTSLYVTSDKPTP
jgi:TetR/AcrR family transcriptional regulator